MPRRLYRDRATYVLFVNHRLGYGYWHRPGFGFGLYYGINTDMDTDMGWFLGKVMGLELLVGLAFCFTLISFALFAVDDIVESHMIFC